MNIAIIGAGLIGQAWAIVFARAGCQVRLWDGDAAALDRAVELIAHQAHELQRQQLLDDAGALAGRVRACPDLGDALRDAAYAQESLPEVVALKKDIFSRLDALAAPTTILASSTSSIPASAFTEHLSGRGRCLVAHPVNPPYLVPVVELCGAPWTEPASVDTARAIMKDVGQKPVVVRKELEGFILNRLQGALLREAFRLVQNGYVSVEDLDATVKDGLGLRWSFMGPFETIDLNAPDGLADYCGRYGGMYESIAKEQADTSAWPAGLIAEIEEQRRAQLPASGLLDRRLWRDQRLMALLRHKKQTETTGST
jgi:3-hydroxyacyl-CoA dehydrogenase